MKFLECFDTAVDFFTVAFCDGHFWQSCHTRKHLIITRFVKAEEFTWFDLTALPVLVALRYRLCDTML